jgi:hypothetical protein
MPEWARGERIGGSWEEIRQRIITSGFPAQVWHRFAKVVFTVLTLFPLFLMGMTVLPVFQIGGRIMYIVTGICERLSALQTLDSGTDLWIRVQTLNQKSGTWLLPLLLSLPAIVL